MSTTVDERVVEMRFDNKQFEQNIQTSLSSLDKLKKSLNLEGAAKGLETVNDAANKCSGNMSPLSNAVETVRVRFSALEVMAITALQNITNSALAAGKNLVSAFTIDPIKTGFEEYETQINAVQTILANTSSKGTTLDQVNNALDELNHYADMTIYNFTEMTRNIGTFTAAGVDLDTSVAAIKGIANLAAVSGSNSQQASTAMYQLSQALAAGTVKLQDWNSVVNAGMGGQVFQDALKETAKVHGIAIDEMIKDEGSFRETLSKGWLTSDILTETLAKFTGDLNEDQLRTMGYTDDQIKSIMEMGKTANDAATKVKTFTQLFDTLKEAAQSGWTQSWEIIVGDFEEAKELLTEVSDTFSAVINASADARNKMLQDWKDLGGRTMMIEAVKNVFEGLVSVAKPVREAFNEIFPPMTGKQLAEITERIRDLTAKFKMGEESSKNLKNTFKGVFAVLDIVGQAFKAVAGGVGELIGLFLPAGNGVLSLTGSFGEYLVKLDETVKKTDVFGKAVSTVVDIVKTAITFVKTAGEKVKEFGKTAGEKFDFPGFELFHSFLERVHDRMAQIGDGAGKMKSGVIVAFEMMGEALEKCKFLKVMEALWTAVKVIAGVVAFFTGNNDVDTFGEKLVPFGEAMKAYSEAIMGMDSAAITNSATAGKALVELANTIPNTGGLVSWFTGDNDLGSFGDSLVQFGSGIKSYSDSISGIDTAIMSSVITQVNRLVEMAKGMAELDTSGMSGFSTALIQLGNNGIDGFINAFTDASGRVTSAATSMLTTFINAANAQKGNLTSTFTTMMQAVLTTLTNYQTQFNTAGSTLMTKFISGIKSQDGNTKTAITNIISGCITAINNKQTQFNTAGANLMIKLIAGVKSKDYETRNAFVNILSSCLTAIANKYPEFQNAGMQCMIKFIAGVKEKAEEVKTAFTGNLNASVTAIRDYHDQFKQAGTYLVEGFADGISENTYRAEAKARAMARAAAEAAEDELDEHSPSRVGYHIGDFFGLGFVNAIGTYAVKAYNASAEMADSAKTGLGNAIAKVKDMIDNGVDGQPTIRPILDLSDVEEKSHRLNTLFSRSQALTVSTGIAAARGRNLQNEDTNPNTGNSYNFTQNNYSPKALSRTEIYRQTKNQFSAMERMVET